MTKRKDQEQGLDIDYILVTGNDPVNRPDDWIMHDADLYMNKKEYLQYCRNQLE